MNRLVHVAFVYETPICPPKQHDPRRYKAGECIGVFVEYDMARKAAEDMVFRKIGVRVPTWKRYKDAEDPDCWFYSEQNQLHSTHYAYVESVRMERRVNPDRRRP